MQAIKFPLEETKKLRVQFLEVKGRVVGEKGVWIQIWEIEIYGEDQEPIR